MLRAGAGPHRGCLHRHLATLNAVVEACLCVDSKATAPGLVPLRGQDRGDRSLPALSRLSLMRDNTLARAAGNRPIRRQPSMPAPDHNSPVGKHLTPGFQVSK